MEEDKKQTGERNAGGSEEKTFTQEEVDEIVRKRLLRERKKTGSEDTTGTDREKALEERELHVMAREKLLEVGMPAKLADILRYNDEESLTEALETIKGMGIENAGQPGRSWGMRQTSRGRDGADAQIRKAMGLGQK